MRDLDNAPRLIERELRLVGDGTCVEVDDAGQDQLDLVVGLRKRAHAVGDVLLFAHFGSHEGAVALGSPDAESGRVHLRQPAVGHARLLTQAVVDAVAVAGIAHARDPAGQCLARAAARRLGQRLEWQLQMVGTLAQVRHRAIEEQMHMGVHQARQQESATLHRPALAGQGVAMVAFCGVRKPPVDDLHGARARVQSLAIEPRICHDPLRCVRACHALYSLRTARSALLPVCSRKFLYALST